MKIVIAFLLVFSLGFFLLLGFKNLLGPVLSFAVLGHLLSTVVVCRDDKKLADVIANILHGAYVVSVAVYCGFQLVPPPMVVTGSFLAAVLCGFGTMMAIIISIIVRSETDIKDYTEI
jgi:hypothetical protein